MKKLVVMVVTVMMMAMILMGSAFAESVEEILVEDIEVEEIIADTISNGMSKKNEKVPNYIITIGGEKFIDIHVNKHFTWVAAIGEGWNVTKEFCANAGHTVADTAVNAYNSTVNWIGGLFGKK